MAKTYLKSVPDTNILLAAEMRPSSASPNKEYFARWRNEEFTVLYSEDTLLEYIKKLREKDSGTWALITRSGSATRSVFSATSVRN
jgi:predicted nucleic acid-binding protein